MRNGPRSLYSILSRRSHARKAKFYNNASDIFSLRLQLHDEGTDIWNKQSGVIVK